MIKQNGYSVLEEVIVLAVISVMVNVVYYRYKTLENRALKTQIKIELTNLRLAVELYKIKNHRYPKSLTELYKSGYLDCNAFNTDNKTILKKLKERFIYDNRTGRVYINPKILKKLE